MDRAREIPGFYFDSEKKKYFRIQPNHIAPEAKHSEQNVRQERREAKRRKISERRKAKIAHDCIKRPLIFRNALAHAGLTRECGESRPNQLRRAQGMTLATNLEKDHTINLGTCDGCGQPNTCYDFLPLDEGRTVVTSAGATAAVVASWGPSDNGLGHGIRPSIFRHGLLPSSGTSLSGNKDMIIATASISHEANVLISNLTDMGQTFADGWLPWDVTISVRVGDVTTEVTDSAVHKDTSAGALIVSTSGTSGKAYVLDLGSGRPFAQLPAGRHGGRQAALRSTDWLDRRTGILGGRNGDVMLWDVRHGGSTTRFRHPGEAKQVHSAGNGCGVWVASAGRVSKYDTRMPDSSMKRAPPVCDVLSDSFSPDMQMAVWKEAGMVAVAGKKGVVELFDEHSGIQSGSTQPTAELDTERYNMGRIRTGTDYDGKMCLWYAFGARIYKYVF